MSVQRRLLHWTRALRHGSPPSRHSRPDLPAPTSPEPLGLSRDMQRVSLDPKSYPVGTRRNWNVDRPSSLTTTPLGPNNARLTPQAVAPQVWRTVVDNPKLALRLGLTHQAVSCVCDGIPDCFTADDIKRLVPFDPTRYVGTHPVVEARRIYRRGTSIQRHVYIRFVDNEALREFLQHSSQILVFGRYFRVRLLDKDKDPYHVRTGTLLPQDVTEEKLLHWRRQYFDDNTGIATVLVDNLPNVGPPYPIPGWARDGFKPYRFDWAYPWNINSPKKDDYEKNCFRAQDWKKGAIKHLFQRWLFRFKDANNAWRFARLVDGTDFPGYPDTPLRATVID